METTGVQITQPLALSRVGSMVGAMLEEIRRGPLDQPARRLLRGTFECALAETRRLVPEAERRELDRVFPPLGDTTASDVDLRLAHAQLVGWLQGFFAGAQLAAVVEETRMYAHVDRSVPRAGSMAGAGSSGGWP